MNCPKCGTVMPEGARHCPGCGATLTGQTPKQTHIDVDQQVGQVEGGKVTAVEVGQVQGNLTVEATVNQVEAKVIQGDYVDRQTIIQNVLVLGPDAMDQIVQKLAALQGVDKAAVQQPGAQVLPENVSRQITEIVAAQREAAAQGVAVSAPSAYRLGLMAAYNRDYTASARLLAPGHAGGSRLRRRLRGHRLAAAKPGQRRPGQAKLRLGCGAAGRRPGPRPCTPTPWMRGRWRCEATSPRPWRRSRRPGSSRQTGSATARRRRGSSNRLPGWTPRTRRAKRLGQCPAHVGQLGRRHCRVSARDQAGARLHRGLARSGRGLRGEDPG